jgi:hypothetical protein
MLEEQIAQLSEQQVELLRDFLELFKIGIPLVIALLAGYLAYRYAINKMKFQKELEFIERQLVDLYSPMLGVAKKINAMSKLRYELSNAGAAAWEKLSNAEPEAIIERDERYKLFQVYIAHNNEQLTQEIMPAYEELFSIFTSYYWLAEDTTRRYYEDLHRFIEIWHRFLDRKMPAEILKEVDSRDDKIKLLYDDLEYQAERLRSELSGMKKG